MPHEATKNSHRFNFIGSTALTANAFMSAMNFPKETRNLALSIASSVTSIAACANHFYHHPKERDCKSWFSFVFRGAHILTNIAFNVCIWDDANKSNDEPKKVIPYLMAANLIFDYLAHVTSNKKHHDTIKDKIGNQGEYNSVELSPFNNG